MNSKDENSNSSCYKAKTDTYRSSNYSSITENSMNKPKRYDHKMRGSMDKNIDNKIKRTIDKVHLKILQNSVTSDIIILDHSSTSKFSNSARERSNRKFTSLTILQL